MNYYEPEVIEELKIKISNHLNDLGINNVRNEIIAGLKSEQKYISSKFFYDEKGSKLFEDITQLPEYYPTRTEKKVLRQNAPELMSNLKNADIVELGSGDCSKISILINAIPQENLESVSYIPVDISQSAIYQSAQQLVEIFPGLSIKGLVADFINQLHLIPAENRRMFCFLGSTLGNFTENATTSFLKSLNSTMHPGDTFLLGVDLVKPIQVLNDAYNDSQQVTAEFNKNILNVINNIIDADFRPDDFNHKAFFNEEMSRIEMHLIAKKEVEISSPYFDASLKIKKGENIHTENSYKFSMDRIKQIEKMTDLTIKKIYIDENQWFALVLFQK